MLQKRLCLFTSRFGLCSVVLLKELWHGNIIPGEDSRTNLLEMKELLGYMLRHHEDLEKSFSDEQREVFEKFHVAKYETIEYRFGRVKPPQATIRQAEFVFIRRIPLAVYCVIRRVRPTNSKLCDGGEKLERIYKSCRSSYLRIRFQAWNGYSNICTVQVKSNPMLDSIR